ASERSLDHSQLIHRNVLVRVAAARGAGRAVGQLRVVIHAAQVARGAGDPADFSVARFTDRRIARGRGGRDALWAHGATAVGLSQTRFQTLNGDRVRGQAILFTSGNQLVHPRQIAAHEVQHAELLSQ